jgi:AraC-like DNA-binding protein
LKKTSETVERDTVGIGLVTTPKLMVVLARTYQALAEFFAGALVEQGVSWEEFLVLESLLHKEPLDASSIAAKAKVSSSAVSRLLASLTRRGLAVTRRDGRARDELYQLSPAGRRVAATLFEKHQRDIEAVMDSLSVSDIDALLQGLKKVGRRAESLRKTSADARRGLAPWQVRKVTDYMKAHLSEPVRVNDLARQVRLSESAFSRAFKVSMATTPHKWQLRERILTAQFMLAEGERSITQVALATGFTEQSHFARVFKELVGVTPGTWQRRNRH